MGYSPAPERLWPGEAPAQNATLPWAWLSADDQRVLSTEPQECADCHIKDQPYRHPGWRLCDYCFDLRMLRRAGGH